MCDYGVEFVEIWTAEIRLTDTAVNEALNPYFLSFYSWLLPEIYAQIKIK